MSYASMIEDYIALDSAQLERLSNICADSAFQLLDREETRFTVSQDKGGFTFPDFYYQMGVPLFSMRIYQPLRDMLEGCFVKRALLCDGSAQYPYMLVLPPRIDALDTEKSNIIENYGSEESPLYELGKTVLLKDCAGRYCIFKVRGALDNRIFVTEAFKRRAEELEMDGAMFWEAESGE